jgi:hypothetical protein
VAVVAELAAVAAELAAVFHAIAEALGERGGGEERQEREGEGESVHGVS